MFPPSLVDFCHQWQSGFIDDLMDAQAQQEGVSISYFWCQAVLGTSQILWAELVLPEAEGTPQRLGLQTRCCTSPPRCSGLPCSTWCPLSADSSAVETGDTVTQRPSVPSKQPAPFSGSPLNYSVPDPKTTVEQTSNPPELQEKDKDVNWNCSMPWQMASEQLVGASENFSWFTNYKDWWTTWSKLPINPPWSFPLQT